MIDPEALTATCPAGHTATKLSWARHGKHRPIRVIHFGAQLCGGCELRSQRTTRADGRIVMLNFHEARLQAARAEQARPSKRRKLRRRSLVEPKLAELKTHGIGKARYRGERKTLLQLRLTASLVNLKRLFTLDALSTAHTHA